MSCEHAIDGDEPLFDFDNFDNSLGLEASSHPPGASITSPGLFDMSHIPPLSKLDLSSYSTIRLYA